MKETKNWERVAKKIRGDIRDAFEGIEREDDPEYLKFLNGFLLKGVKGEVNRCHFWSPTLEAYEELRDELKQDKNLLPFAEHFIRCLDEGIARYNEFKDQRFGKMWNLGCFYTAPAKKNGVAAPAALAAQTVAT